MSIENNQIFTGIYSTGFPKRCFSVDEKRVVFSTPQKFENRSYVVNIGINLIGIIILYID